ncbi:unnamed protein product [Bemisia tabaci]|uniref:RNA helicase n=1 Tax=Bemisia tabaci TaxID=7038 RepID=A0A9P0CFI2_BEMTA|nr:unnamed protein product [Bemisia tabaci]
MRRNKAREGPRRGPYHKVYADQYVQCRTERRRDPGIDENKCHMCSISFASQEEYEEHQNDIEHKARKEFRLNRREVKKNSACGIKVEFEAEEIFLEVNQQKKVNFNLSNRTERDVTLESIIPLMKLNVVPGVQIIGAKGVSIGPGQSLLYKMVVGFGEETGIFVYPLIFQFLGAAGSIYVYRELKFYSFTSSSESGLYSALAPISPYKPQNHLFVHLVELPTIWAPPLEQGERVNALPKRIQLEKYPIPNLLSKLVNHHLNPAEFEEELDEAGRKEIKKLLDVICHKKPNSEVLTKQNYVDRFRVLLHLEEMQIRKELADYNMNDAILFKAPTNQGLLALKIPGLVENRPSVVRGDSIFIRSDRDKEFRYEGKVAHVNKDSVELLFDPRFYRLYKPGDKVSVQFDINTHQFQVAHRAIERMKNFDILFPTKDILLNVDPDTPIEFFDDKIKSNPEQMQAVRNCVDGSSFPAPYIIFGPPGTGKTSTLIEIVKQLWLRASDRNFKIMICAPSNSAADLITELLLLSIPVSDVYRLYSVSRSYDSVPEKIKNSTSCNYDGNGRVWYPEVGKLKAYKIIITTLVASARLVTAGLGLDNHFSHIIIDESGQADEPQALIPISGFAGFKPKDGVRRAQIILAGDPNQLGPIICGRLSELMGLNISLLERLMSLELYQKNNNKYNPNVITKLVQNHRSHGAVIEVSNILFYDNELKVNGDKNIINMAVGWSQLPNKNYPVIFHGVKGEEERESSSPSWFNRAEIVTIVKYLKAILEPGSFNGQTIKQEDVGIISPYHKQVMKLRRACELQGWATVKVGSVEEFQGSEKLVTLVSTVRSKAEVLNQDLKYNLGFLSNPKRLNVALTRARALSIVVGNPDVLLWDPRWRTFILQCRSKGAVSKKGYFNKEALEQSREVPDLAQDMDGLRI